VSQTYNRRVPIGPAPTWIYDDGGRAMTDHELRELIRGLEQILDVLERTAPHVAARIANDINFLADWSASHLYDTEEYRRWSDAP
jgi:hypothetical protein